MGRPALAVGTHGTITITADKGGWRARTLFRDYDGERREVARWGRTRTAADNAIKLALRDRSAPTGDAITPEMRLRDLSRMWLETINDDLATGSRRTYSFAAGNYVLPGLGALRLRELTVQMIDMALVKVREKHGPGAARSARSVLSGMLGYAVRNGALATNLARDTSPITQKAVKEIRALTVEESVDILVGLRGSDRFRDALDLPDLVDWMLGTGMRIGETCAIRREVLSGGVVEVNATVIREPGVGLFIQKRPKTAAGHRVLTVTPHLAGVLERRTTEARLQGPGGVVFCSPRGKLRDPSNTSADLRAALDELGYPWVTSHVFRKTVATRLDEAGCTPREVADVLGHEKPSMTLDVYMGRKVVSARMAEVLDRS